MTGNFVFLHTSPERMATVEADIRAGSEPRLSFYSLLVTSSLIAGLGLVADSPAVIIGAMLVSPLMTPIFGISLAMLRGDVKLFWRALTAEVFGVLLSVLVALLLGLLIRGVDTTPQMIMRTEPHLLDLLVAVLAGFAGAFALVDERISPALPGVAIATAIVPPLSNSGLCLAFGAEVGAWGSFLLFLTNFFSILVVGFITFAAAGMAPTFNWTDPREVARRFGLAFAGFLIIAVLLVDPFLSSLKERRTELTVKRVLTQELAEHPLIDLEGFMQNLIDDRVEVVASVRSGRIVTPQLVASLQDSLNEALSTPVQLVVRSSVARDVAPLGSVAEPVARDLDGELLENTLTAEELYVRTVEQVLFEKLALEAGFTLSDITISELGASKVALVKMDLFRELPVEEIRTLRNRARARLDDPSLELIVQTGESTMASSQESVLLEWTDLDGMGNEYEALAAEIRSRVCARVEEMPNLYCIQTHLNHNAGSWRALVQVVGPHPPTPDMVRALQESISAELEHVVRVDLWFRADAVVTSDGYQSYRDFTASGPRIIDHVGTLFGQSAEEPEEASEEDP
jgi:uncharacterized hydrophobic protein (TIGR00271 family)